MKKLLTLIRAGLRSNFGLAVLHHRLFREKKDRWLVPLFGVAFLGVLPSIYGLVLLIQGLFLTLKPLGQERALLTLGVLGGQFFILVFGLYYVISAFYFSRDLEFLIPLPLKPFEVMTSKFAVIQVNEYLTVMVIVLPVLAGYGILARGGLAYWTNAVLVYLFLPVIPLAVVSILVVILMRLINLSRKKDALILIGSIILIVFGIGIQFVLGRPAHGKPDTQAMTAFFTSPDSLLNVIGSRFPPSIWATKAMAGGFSATGLLNLALFVGTSVLLFAGILVLSERLFYRGLVGLGEVTARRRALSAAQMSQRISSGRHPVRAIFAREWRLMNRTPIFLLNGVLVVVIVPVVFVLMASTGGRGDNTAILKMMTAANPVTVILAAALFMTICGSLNGTASSTFSREGGQFWISRVIPVSPRDQVTAKFLHSYLISVLGTATASVVAVVILHLKPAYLAAAIVLSLAAGVLLVAVGMMIDLARPLLDWANPQKAIKQNLNVFIAVFADIGILTGLFFLLRFLGRLGVKGVLAPVALFVLLVALSAVSLRLLVAFAGKRYGEIEV
jgi:ABC-2 type transport system permease protein